MNENLNLIEILKDCPEGTKLYSPAYGDVKLVRVSRYEDIEEHPIDVQLSNNSIDSFTKDGRMFFKFNGECMLFPSREQRDWSKFNKKPKFDPKTLQPFDKVLVRDACKEYWGCEFFSYLMEDGSLYPYSGVCTTYKHCIPYNEDTKHLVGTKEEAPEFYRY